MKSVLIVDDRGSDLYMLRMLLEGHGHTVFTASNGEDALKAALKTPPDMIISDIMMPVMDGFVLCREWMGDVRLKDIPFVFYTATYTDAKDEEFALSLGAVRFIVKPTEPDELMKIIQGVVSDMDEGKIEPGTPAPATNQEVLRLYDERLVNKLEQKTLALEEEIAERMLAEEALRESEERFRSLFDQGPLGIGLMDGQGALFDTNTAFGEVLGYSREELLGRQANDITYPEDREPSLTLTRQLLAGEIPGFHLEKRYLKKDGTPVWCSITAAPVRNPQGEVLYTVGFLEDISARKILEDQLRQAQKMEAVGQLTGGIAHDFNNVLAVILLSADLMATGWSRGEPIDLADLNAIRDAAKSASGITRKLLSFSRQAELRTAPTDLRRVVEKMGGMLRTAVPESVELRLRTETETPSVRVDETAIEQTLLNLVTNARDAMPNGGVLSVVIKEVLLDEEYCAQQVWAQPGLYACLEVADTGMGMDAETQRRVFEPFFTTKDPGRGTGLGMPMVHGLTEQQGGHVCLLSEEGEGTTVRLYFPACLDEMEQSARAASPEDLPGGSETLLVVEDQADLRETARRVLKRQGYTVLTASNGREALEVLEGSAAQVALVFSDVIMPVMGGLELYQALGECEYAGKFLLASGYTGPEAMDEALKDIPYIQKPWLLSDLLRAVRDALDGSNRHSASQSSIGE